MRSTGLDYWVSTHGAAVIKVAHQATLSIAILTAAHFPLVRCGLSVMNQLPESTGLSILSRGFACWVWC